MTAPADRPLRIAVAGAGAIGTVLAARLARAGHAVHVLARGDTLDAIRRRGLRLEDAAGTTETAVAAGERADFGPMDVVFLCVKSHQLPALAPSIAGLVAPETLVVPILNGVPFWYFHREGGRFEGRTVEAVDPGGALMRHLPPDQLIGAVTFITAECPAPGHAVARNPHLLMLGEPANGISPRLRSLCAVLDAAGVEARPIERIRDKLWTKIVANLTSNPLSVVTGATLEAIYGRADLLPTVRAVMLEAMLAAACHGARMTVDPIEFLELGRAMGPVRTSMLQDAERGRPLELAAIGDAVLELADLYRLPMPATRALLAQAHAFRPTRTPRAVQTSLENPV
ncbi:MAG: 2-dehydropantoate 2-reductase [Xylophilus ampelinus]